MNYSVKLNLLKIPSSSLVSLKGKTATKECIVIPVEDAKLYKGEKGVYIDLFATELQNPKYEETHFISQSISKEEYETMTEEERKARPILGGMKPFERKKIEVQPTQAVEAAQMIENEEDLPF